MKSHNTIFFFIYQLVLQISLHFISNISKRDISLQYSISDEIINVLWSFTISIFYLQFIRRVSDSLIMLFGIPNEGISLILRLWSESCRPQRTEKRLTPRRHLRWRIRGRSERRARGLLHCLKHSPREWLSTGMADKERVSTSIEVLEPPCVRAYPWILAAWQGSRYIHIRVIGLSTFQQELP